MSDWGESIAIFWVIVAIFMAIFVAAGCAAPYSAPPRERMQRVINQDWCRELAKVGDTDDVACWNGDRR